MNKELCHTSLKIWGKTKLIYKTQVSVPLSFCFYYIVEMKVVDCWNTLFGAGSINALRSLDFFYKMYSSNQSFTMRKNRVNLPSLENYQYNPGKHISRNGIRYLNQRMKKYGAVVVVDRYYVEKWGHFCSILKITPAFGVFLQFFIKALQDYDRTISEARARREVKW